MEFNLDLPPPEEGEIVKEREAISDLLRKVHNRDMIVTSVLILVTSLVVALAVFWFTGSIKYAAISSAIYPVLSVVLHWVGVTGSTGFRSAALKMIELNNSLISLKPIPVDNADIPDLSSKYGKIHDYAAKVNELGREFVNAELAMFWEWDTSTQAKTAKARDYVHKARETYASDGTVKVKEAKAETKAEVESESEAIEGFVLDDEAGKTE